MAGELEARWNSALAQVAEAEARLVAADKTAEPLNEEQKQRLSMLSEDLSALWNQPEAPIPLKKRILRTVLTEIIVDSEPIPQLIACVCTGLVECTRNCVWNETSQDTTVTVRTVR